METINTDAPIIDHRGPALPVWVCKNCGSILGSAPTVKPPGCCGPDHVALGDALTAKMGPDGKITAIRYL